MRARLLAVGFVLFGAGMGLIASPRFAAFAQTQDAAPLLAQKIDELSTCLSSNAALMRLQADVVRGKYMSWPDVVARFEANPANRGKTLAPDMTVVEKPAPPAGK